MDLFRQGAEDRYFFEEGLDGMHWCFIEWNLDGSGYRGPQVGFANSPVQGQAFLRLLLGVEQRRRRLPRACAHAP